MGIEVRRVASDWEHPTEHATGGRRSELAYRPDTWKRFRPMFDEDWLTAYRRWCWEAVKLAFVLYARRPVLFPFVLIGAWRDRPPKPYTYVDTWAEWRENRPSWYASCYRQERWKDSDRTHYQLYETVSEGTPISPPFATVEELSAWCAEQTENGRDVWVETAGMTREQWDRFFANGGYAMSMVITPERGMESGIEYASREVV